jgi:GT2 family glycosyltransferase
VEAVLGAALFVRREVLDRVGPLDDGYFFFLEETDWCWRMREAGYRVRHVPGARMQHLSGASSKRVASTRTRIEYHRSLYRFVRRHRGRAALAALVAVRVLENALPLAVPPFGPRGRERWRDRVAVLAWHVRGCPAGAGLEGLARAERGKDAAAIG